MQRVRTKMKYGSCVVGHNLDQYTLNITVIDFYYNLLSTVYCICGYQNWHETVNPKYFQGLDNTNLIYKSLAIIFMSF